MSAISIEMDFKNFGYSPDLEFKESGGNPVKLTKVLKAGNSIRVISQNGKISGKPTARNKANSIPISFSGLIPRQVGSLWSNKRP